MQNKNIDGVKKSPKQKLFLKKPALVTAKNIRTSGIDGISKKKLATVIHLRKFKRARSLRVAYVVPFNRQSKMYSRSLVVASIFVFALLIAFSGGMWTAFNTQKTEAEGIKSSNSENSNYSVLLDAQLPANTSISNDVLFNTPIEYLKNYLANTAEPDVIAKRTQQLTQFLKERNSPLVDEAGTIAEQPHWKLILGIAFAESTLGKHCYEFNCSGIGGSSIKTYSSSKQWIVDFNRLLEKRYKDKTLEQMCGVYVQPCTSNWLLATKQILNSLEENNIQ